MRLVWMKILLALLAALCLCFPACAEFDDMEYVFNILKCRDGVLDLKSEDKNIIYRMKTAE